MTTDELPNKIGEHSPTVAVQWNDLAIKSEDRKSA